MYWNASFRTRNFDNNSPDVQRYECGGLSLTAQTIIDNVINFYEGILTNPITVNIEFYNMTSGLGSSFFVFYTEPYTTYRSALVADQSSADDATALASLPANVPIGTTGNIGLKSANGRALGLNTPEITFGATSPCGQIFTGSGCIGLNVSNTTTGGGVFSLVRDGRT
jgi:hypothetical protein